MYSTVKRTGTVLIVTFLILLFTIPSHYLSKTVDELRLQSAAARRAVESGDDPAPHFSRMNALLDEAAPTLKLFLSHTLVDETRLSVHALSPMTDPEHLFSDLEALEILLDQLNEAEVFHFSSLL